MLTRSNPTCATVSEYTQYSLGNTRIRILATPLPRQEPMFPSRARQRNFGRPIGNCPAPHSQGPVIALAVAHRRS